MAAALAHWHMDRLDDVIAAGVSANVGADANAAWNRLADYFVRSGEPAASEQVLREALALGEFDACMRVAELALEAQRPNVATVYLGRAAELDAGNPTPWLQLAELAIAAQQPGAAREAIENAEQRGADAETLNTLKSQAGIAETNTQGLRRTIIR
jgi:Tfp pilus assembly protein PilF